MVGKNAAGFSNGWKNESDELRVTSDEREGGGEGLEELRGEIGGVDGRLAEILGRWLAAGGGEGEGLEGVAGEVTAELGWDLRVAAGRGGTRDAAAARRCAEEAREALERRAELARRIAECKEGGRWAEDFRLAEESGDEERLEALVGDWVAEARVLERVRWLGGEAGEALEREWAERIIPWTKRQEVRHLTDPRRGA